MKTQTLSSGNIVTHPIKKGWGPGKVIKTEGHRVFVLWRDRGIMEARVIDTSVVPLDLASDQSDPVLDQMTATTRKSGAKKYTAGSRSPRPKKPMASLQEAINSFTGRFPLGFKDPEYIGGTKTGKKRERAYKVDAHERLVEAVSDGQYERLLEKDPAELCQRLKRAMRSTNLIFSIEKAAFVDGMEDLDRAVPFFAALWELLKEPSPTEPVFTSYITSLQQLPVVKTAVAKWTNATIFPFLFRPDQHLFVKPTVTQNAARGIGIHLNYKPTPNWLTYSRILEMSHSMLDELRPLGAQDMIDVQSFIWVCYGGYK